MIKIVVFDPSRGFGRHIKLKLSHKFDINLITDERAMAYYDLKINEVLIFIVNNDRDYLLFRKVYSKVLRVILGISKKKH